MKTVESVQVSVDNGESAFDIRFTRSNASSPWTGTLTEIDGDGDVYETETRFEPLTKTSPTIITLLFDADNVLVHHENAYIDVVIPVPLLDDEIHIRFERVDDIETLKRSVRTLQAHTSEQERVMILMTKQYAELKTLVEGVARVTTAYNIYFTDPEAIHQKGWTVENGWKVHVDACMKYDGPDVNRFKVMLGGNLYNMQTNNSSRPHALNACRMHLIVPEDGLYHVEIYDTVRLVGIPVNGGSWQENEPLYTHYVPNTDGEPVGFVEPYEVTGSTVYTHKYTARWSKGTDVVIDGFFKSVTIRKVFQEMRDAAVIIKPTKTSLFAA